MNDPRNTASSDLHARIDPELAAALAAIPRTDAGIFDLSDIPGTRAAIQAMAEAAEAAAPLLANIAVEVLRADRPDASALDLRVLRPVGTVAPLPALIWFHGGGQVLGFAGQEDGFLAAIVRAVGCIVVAVEYRLAPEYPAPAAAEDGVLAYAWIHREADRLGIDPTRIGIAGASGNGGIAAAAVLIIRDRGLPPPRLQALNYPMIDDRSQTASAHAITDIGVWDRRSSILAWQAILGDRVGGADVSPYEAAARATDLAGLPPTFLAVGELDLFLDEDLDFARGMMAAGVPVELHVYPGAYHAWDLFAPASRLTRTFQHSWYDYLSRHLR